MKFDDTNPDYFLHDFDQNSPAGNDATDNRQQPSREINFDTPASQPAAQPQQKRRGCRRVWIWFLTIVTLTLAATIYIRYFTPYVTESRMTGYITNVERRGIFFKTFEGEMISETALADTTRIYTRDFVFSIPDRDVALKLQEMQGSGQPVKITYERYYGTLPWRGATNCIVTAVEHR